MQIDVLKEQFIELQSQHPHLKLQENKNSLIITGLINCCREWNDIPLPINYEIKMRIKKNFPTKIPLVWEISNKIPKNYSHYMLGKPLCLGIESEIALKLQKNPSLIFFMDEFVLAYFYSLKFWINFGRMPFGERSHNKAGICEFYKEYFFVDTENKVIALLESLVKSSGEISPESLCPCGSNLPVRLCWHCTLLTRSVSDFEYRCYKKDLATISG